METKADLYLHVKKWTVSAMAAVKGKKGMSPNIHLLHGPHAGVCPPSTFSSCFVGGLSGWVGSFSPPSAFKIQEHDSNIIPCFKVSAQVASNCLALREQKRRKKKI